MKQVLSPISLWYHDLGSCLQSCMALILQYHAQDPTLVLGACWDFYHLPNDFKGEEYYYPCRWKELANSLMPYHPVSSHWHYPMNAQDGWCEVKQIVAQGHLAVVAVDNFHLPFRPAYHDIHAAHLIVIYGFDEERGEVYVADSSPPGYLGPMSLQQLELARNSANPPDRRDLFFSSSPIANRWIEVVVHTDFPSLTYAWVREVIQQNVQRFQEPSAPQVFSGMEGMAQYLFGLCTTKKLEDQNRVFEELYVMGWGIQAGTALHADFLARTGILLQRPELREIGRQVDRLAHHWTALRMLAAHARLTPNKVPDVLRRLQRRSEQILIEQKWILEQFTWLLND